MKLSSAIKICKEKNKIPLIAEIKIYSPKDGPLLKDRDPLEILDKYKKGGACAISVVTEPEYFKGSLEILKTVRENTDLPVLRKDFIKNINQIEETKRIGAEAILLIACMLSSDEIYKLNEYAHKLGLETVIEVHTQNDIEKIKDLKLDIVGINNKDILNLERDKDTVNPTIELVNKIPHSVIKISESGIRNMKDIKRVIDAGCDAILMGTALLKAKDIEEKVRKIVNARW